MDIRVEQSCPQCGAPVTLSETSRLLTCPYCGTKNFLQTSSVFRYVLPDKVEPPERGRLLYAPYIRFRGNIFLVSEAGMTCRVVDTTQQGTILPALPPSLGVRAQAMKLARLTAETGGRFLRLSIKTKVILEKAAQIGEQSGRGGQVIFHRAYIGDTVSLIYLPLLRDNNCLFDAVTDTMLIDLDRETSLPLQGKPFNPRWQVNFLPTLCPRCGGDLDGEGDCLVLTCGNCDTAWEIGNDGLRRLQWQILPGDGDHPLYLAFWKISTRIPAMEIESFADFINKTNQPVVPRPQWHERPMSFWIPAFKLRPKIFLRVARQVTIGQWRLDPEKGHVAPNLYPVTLPASEARQAVKVTLAASATSPGNIFPFLPQARLRDVKMSLVYLPFADKQHDWMQPETGAVIDKNVLRFGRTL